MPEGPEVAHITRRLNKKFAGTQLTDITFKDPRYRQTQVRNDIDDFMAELPLTIHSVKCKGKFIYFELENDWTIWHTLGMSGSWRASEKSANYKNAHRLTFHSTGGDYFYRDPRKFGTFKFMRDPEALQDKLHKLLGPDMLAEDVSDTDFITAVRRKKHWNVTRAIMDQKVIAGIGNYIKAEALYYAKINPWKKIEQLTEDQLKSLNYYLKWVIRAAYEAKGATIKDYVLPDGTTGDYKFQFAVYSKRQCPDGHPVKHEETPDRRTTWWVPQIQS